MLESWRPGVTDKFLPDDPRQFVQFLRKRAEGHALGYDIALYGRPHQWLAIAKLIEDNCPRASWCAPVVDDTNPGAGAEPATSVRLSRGSDQVGRTGGSNPPTGATTLNDAAKTILETFEKDDAQGFRSRDRQLAIALLSKALRG
jgi:hypothetical protein